MQFSNMQFISEAHSMVTTYAVVGFHGVQNEIDLL